MAVYLTSPDYLGGLLDIKGLAQAVHQYGTLLLVDNAHGAYQHFLTPASHPLDLGADLCCDSAHGGSVFASWKKCRFFDGGLCQAGALSVWFNQPLLSDITVA